MIPYRALSGVLAATVFAFACTKGEQAGQNADSTARNLTLATPESTATAGDMPAASQPAPAATPAAPQSRPPATRPSAPATPASATLAAGTRFDMALDDTITSRTAKPGDTWTATIVDDVKDAAGHVVIPAGATVQGTVVEVKPSPNPQTPGTLRLAVNGMKVRGTAYAVTATIDSLEVQRQGRGVTAGDAAKVGAGAAAGAILGRIVTRSTTGTVVGGVVGGVVGAGVAANTKDSDVMVPAGQHILASLAQALTISLR